jgi:flagellar assembly factor FliW
MTAIVHGTRELPPACAAAPFLWAASSGDPARAIRFPNGLPGFPRATRFLLQPAVGATGLLALAAADGSGLRFVVTPHGVDLLAESAIATACEAALGCARADAAVLLVVTVAAVAGERLLYVNLRAPILLDTILRVAVQHVLPDARYPVRHLLVAPGVAAASRHRLPGA